MLLKMKIGKSEVLSSAWTVISDDNPNKIWIHYIKYGYKDVESVTCDISFVEFIQIVEKSNKIIHLTL